MCGIVGYLGNQPFQEFILSGLKLLQNRGYDSAGLSYIEHGEINTIKYASAQNSDAIMQLEHDVLLTTQKINQDNIQAAIGHTRWATHGPKTQLNAHPHHDNEGRISLVHNGIIENFQEIKSELTKLRYVFHSQTDTEVIAVLVGRYLDAGHSMEDSIRKTVARLSGTWALVILHRDFPNKLWVCRNGSPLLLGSTDDYIMVASEHIAFGPYIQKYIVLDNHDILEITQTLDQGFTYNTCLAKYVVQEKAASAVEYEPTGHAHWMIKEITEQSDAIYRAINHGGRISGKDRVKLGGLDQCREQLLALDHLILLGCGTSYHAGLWALDLFKSLDIFDTVTIYDGAEFGEHDIPGRRGKRPVGSTGLILLSQSGETRDLHRCIQIANENDLMTIGLVNVPDSTIARETHCGVYLNAGREVAVASTKSFTNQCVVLALVAVWFSQERGTCLSKRQRMIQDLRKLPIQVKHIMERDTVEAIQYIVKRLNALYHDTSANRSMFLLGKGSEEAIAKEGALKLKEVAYVHAEGYSSSALKHGPFALICENTPIILVDVDEQYRAKNQNAMHEVAARGAYVVHIRDYIDQEYQPGSKQTGLYVQPNSTFSGVLANVYIQIMSYYLAVEQGIHPDFPRNLAKVVTVE